MHTTTTLDHLTNATRVLGSTIRVFSESICPIFDTYESRKERAKRVRISTKDGKQVTGQVNKKTFNLQFIKLHLLGYYVKDILQYGPSSGFSTQPV